MASGPITSLQIDGEKGQQWQILFSWASKSLQMVTAAMKLRCLLFTRKSESEWCLTLCNPWTVAHQAPLSMEFSRQEYWIELPFPFPGESSQSRHWTWVSCIAGRFFTIWATSKALSYDKPRQCIKKAEKLLCWQRSL